MKMKGTAAAAAAAKSLQPCPTLCDPIDGSPPGSPIPGILQARVLEWGAIAFSMKPNCLGSNPRLDHANSIIWSESLTFSMALFFPILKV